MKKSSNLTFKVKRGKSFLGCEYFYTLLPNGFCAIGFTLKQLKKRVKYQLGR